MSFSAIEPEGFYIEGLQSLSLSTPLVDYYEEDSVRFCINWGGGHGVHIAFSDLIVRNAGAGGTAVGYDPP